MFVLIKDYNASVANKEGLQLATEGANVSYTMRLFAVAVRGDFKYFFADFVRKGRGRGYPQNP